MTVATNEQAIDQCFEVMEMMADDRLKFTYDEEQQVIIDLVEWVLAKADQQEN